MRRPLAIPETDQAYTGPSFFSGGFRPFFLGAGISAALVMILWVAAVSGHAVFGHQPSPAWHAHEMIFGFIAAAVAGFALTAIPNWTGRAPLRGWPLAALFAAWLAGRAAMFDAGDMARAVDSLFLVALALFAGFEIWAGKNRRNFPIALVFALLALANILHHLDELARLNLDGAGFRLGLASVTLLLSLIGGRIIPAFTGNWLRSRQSTVTPAPFGTFDKLVLLASAIVLVLWVIDQSSDYLVAGFSLLSGLHLVRLGRWKGWLTGAEPMVLALHTAYLWLPLAFASLAYGLYYEMPNLGIHALTAGAMASMIMAVMTRATLGHSGRELKADAATIIIYLAVWLAGACRVISFIASENYMVWVQISAGLWVLGFGLFAVHYSRYFFARA